MSTAMMTFEDHYRLARAHALRDGLADAIHYAPDWQRRVDALYAQLNAMGAWPSGPMGLLPDGRMVVTGTTSSDPERAITMSAIELPDHLASGASS